MYEIGLSTCGKIVDENLFRTFSESGIKHMEISLTPQEYHNFDYRITKEYASFYGVNLWSFHLPFYPFSEIELSDKALCNETLNYYAELIKKASAIGLDKFVVHPSGEPLENAERYDRMECSKESLYFLAELAKKCGGIVAVEDLPRTCLGNNSDEILELVSVHDDLKVCFDTNHLLSENVCDFVRKIGNKIVTIHVSDCDFTDEKHWLPGEGKINWQDLLHTLKEVGYSGVWMYEIPFENTAKIQRNRELICEDFVKNANEIFANIPFTIIR